MSLRPHHQRFPQDVVIPSINVIQLDCKCHFPCWCPCRPWSATNPAEEGIGVPRSSETATPQDPTVESCLSSVGGAREGHIRRSDVGHGLFRRG